MPTYDYECTSCGHSFEAFHGITAKPIEDCPECEEKKVRRLIGSGSGIIFKGSGFYTTDYRSKEYKDRARKEAESATPKSGKGDKGGSADSKKTTSEGKGNVSKQASAKEA